ncbi:uncharacterized protein Z518_00403 [Rhinocladiella mackenziei CBS 650.93]|uniref:Uncharacterized protein n=1 Tax=Rhinocladiella mackenziei CBS 650.93 TaxID=1442369 RepID=A0A0D2ITD9_9EURO|nr:uncharacterized protein Z518_00403 [Rhinocladiella mackenziei CBS 650.93]KIX09324.1 hypothetical protein Z518_00403 [Rhinocladiella mackenziei CBS 650.93]
MPRCANSQSPSQANDTPWIGYYSFLIIFFGIVTWFSVSRIEESFPKLPDTPEGENLPSKNPAATEGQNVPSTAPVSPNTKEHSDWAHVDIDQVEKNDASSPSVAPDSGQEISDDQRKSLSAPHRRALMLGSFWQMVQLCLFQLYGGLGARLIVSNRRMGPIVLPVLVINTFVILLSIVHMDRGYKSAVSGRRLAKGEEKDIKSKSDLFDNFEGAVFLSLFVPWIRIFWALLF